MIKVFFYYGSCTELIAIFESEDIYNACVSALESRAETVGAELTESVTEDGGLEDLIINDL